MAGEDEYEATYMSDGGLVQQTKSKAPWWFAALVLLPALFSTIAVASMVLFRHAPALALLAIVPALLISFPIWILFSILRATITTKYLHIQYGLFGPKIPLEKIHSCEAVNYDWKQYGGFGIRGGRDGSTAYNMAGDQGMAIKVRYTNEKGKEKVLLLSAPDPDGFAAALNKARGASSVPVRVSTTAATVKTKAAEPVVDSEFEESDEGSAKKHL